MSEQRKRVADVGFLVALMLFIVAGIMLVPPHGDEYMQMSMARDVFYEAQGEWARLAYVPPVQPDTEPYLRLLNGTLNKTLIGLTWLVTGRTEQDLPGIYAWGESQEWNIAQGNVPSDEALALARWSSALLTALGVIPIFVIGWHVRLRSVAYPAALLYALHPVVLINGRRAMMEGSLMLFSLLTVAWAVEMIVTEHSAAATGWMRRLSPLARYVGLGVCGGLVLSAKYTGIAIVATALLAVMITSLARRRTWRAVLYALLAGTITVVIWFALNPIFWNDPVGALRASVEARVDLLNRQSTDPLLAYKTTGERFSALLTQPFLSPPQYYEAPTWAGVIEAPIAAYENSALRGWAWTPLIGVVLTALMLYGLLRLVIEVWRRNLVAVAILMWLAVMLITSMSSPLNWQRYYLPLILVGVVLAATGIGYLVVWRLPTTERQPTA
ncbi:MAG: phospholipid carrier-dependent glycosyltransferase [Anaerolineae bacterium]|nr:phospholipid carrier-dependent glycosyltransferase [Anaerolineae bacterium]